MARIQCVPIRMGNSSARVQLGFIELVLVQQIAKTLTSALAKMAAVLLMELTVLIHRGVTFRVSTKALRSNFKTFHTLA